jgi:hypothetical protein
VSKRNRPAAKARRRAERSRPPAGGYPVMPPGTCYGSSTILAACYPELRYAEGIRTRISPVRPPSDLKHAWNVNRHTGEIWDSTLPPKGRAVAEAGYGELRYTEGESTLGPGAFAGWCSVAVEETSGATAERKRAVIELLGKGLAALPCDCPGVGPDGCVTHGQLAPVTAS